MKIMNTVQRESLLKAAKLIKECGKSIDDIINEREVIHKNHNGDAFYNDENLVVHFIQKYSDGTFNLHSHLLEDCSTTDHNYELRHGTRTDIYRTEEEALLAGLKKWSPKMVSDDTKPSNLVNKKEIILEVILGKDLQYNFIDAGWISNEGFDFSKPPEKYRIKPSKETRTFQTDKVKIEWTIEENKLSMQVLEMDERFRGSTIEFKSKNGLKVKSNWYTEMHPGTMSLYLRGKEKKKDHRTIIVKFNSPQELQSYLTKAEEALIEWSEKWEGFRELVYENSIDQKFYKGRANVYRITKKGIYSRCMINIKSVDQLDEDMTFTESSLTRSGAYQIYSNYLKEQGE